MNLGLGTWQTSELSGHWATGILEAHFSGRRLSYKSERAAEKLLEHQALHNNHHTAHGRAPIPHNESPQSAATTRCIYHMVHLPHIARIQVPQLPHSASTQIRHLPQGSSITWCTYQTVRRPKHFMHLPHGAPTAWLTKVPQLPHSVPTQALHAPIKQWYLVR